jgi:signal transduction histidine kinase
MTNKNELSQVIVIILTNAKDALVDADIINPKIDIEVTKVDEKITISLSNNAGEIDKNIIGDIFQQYFTTKDFADGTGLGLYIAKLIVNKLNLSIGVSILNGWTTFTIKN